MYWEIACKSSLSQHICSLKNPIEIVVYNLPVAFVTVHHYREDNTLLWTMSHISARYPVLPDVVESPALTVAYGTLYSFHDSIIGQRSVGNFMTTISNPKIKPRFHDYYRDHLFNFLLYYSSLLVCFNTHWSNSLNHSESS